MVSIPGIKVLLFHNDLYQDIGHVIVELNRYAVVGPHRPPSRFCLLWCLRTRA